MLISWTRTAYRGAADRNLAIRWHSDRRRPPSLLIPKIADTAAVVNKARRRSKLMTPPSAQSAHKCGYRLLLIARERRLGNEGIGERTSAPCCLLSFANIVSGEPHQLKIGDVGVLGKSYQNMRQRVLLTVTLEAQYVAERELVLFRHVGEGPPSTIQKAPQSSQANDNIVHQN
jgi:hypothetical protein